MSLQFGVFNQANVNSLPNNMRGIYGIYGESGTLYIGRSGSCIKTRLKAHLSGRGSETIAMLIKEGWEGKLFFSYMETDKYKYDEAKEILRNVPVGNKRRELKPIQGEW